MRAYLDGVKGVAGEDGTDAAEAAGKEVLDFAGPLFLSHVGSAGAFTTFKARLTGSQHWVDWR